MPIFHEGMKFWSCCQRKTSDFTAFLNQEGCTRGKCKWIKGESSNGGAGVGSSAVQCRHDWHQTGANVTVAIYGKRYDPEASYVEVSPVRLRVHAHFPEQGGDFDMDVELSRVIIGLLRISFHFFREVT